VAKWRFSGGQVAVYSAQHLARRNGGIPTFSRGKSGKVAVFTYFSLKKLFIETYKKVPFQKSFKSKPPPPPFRAKHVVS
jgi:hypothetical protein